MEEQQLNELRELNQYNREQRRFEILQRERAVTREEKNRRNFAIIAGTSFLATSLLVMNNSIDSSIIMQYEMESLYSFESLRKYYNDLGPATILALTTSLVSMMRSIRSNIRLRRLRDEQEDFSNSLEMSNQEEENIYVRRR